jgi:hypothetical protein
MPTIRIIFVFLIYSYGILTIAHAETAAVFINVPCDSVVRDEFIQWKDNERDKFFDNVTLPPKEHQSHADSSLPKHAPVANEYSNTDKIRNQYNEKSDNQYQSINSPQRETYEDLDNLQSNRSNRHFSGTPSMPEKSQTPTHSFSSHAYEDTMPAQTDTQPRLPVSSFSVNAVSGNSHVYYIFN